MADRDREFDDLPVLEVLGERIVKAAREDERRVAGQGPGRLGRWRRSRHPQHLIVLIGVGLGVAGGAAYAATQLIQTGRPVPAVSGGRLDQIVPGTARLLSVRAADPGGGPPWGMRVFRTKGKLACVQTGRVVDGKLGVLGQDGVFNNDGRFHELPVAAEGCGSLDGKGQVFLSGGSNTQTASGYDGSGTQIVGGCETRRDREMRLYTPETLRDALRLQLRRREFALARVQRRVIARAERRARQKIPMCPDADLRDVIWGFEGSLAQKVTLTEKGHTRTVIPAKHESGAYLVVLRGNFSAHQRLQRRTFYPGNVVCGRGFGVHSTRGCSPPPGFAARTRRPGDHPRLRPRPKPPPVMHLPVTVFPGLAIDFTPPRTGHRYSVLLRCRGNTFMDVFSPKVLPAGRPHTLRLRGPLPKFCGPRPTGTIYDATTGQQLGTFRLRRRR